MAVEKLSPRKFAEIASRQEALQTISPRRLDIFHHVIFHFFQENRLFQQPRLLTTGTPPTEDFRFRRMCNRFKLLRFDPEWEAHGQRFRFHP